MPARNPNETWISSVADLALVYGSTESEVAQVAYALSEQVHAKYCMGGGLSHRASRPDEHIALAMLAGLAAGGWWLTRQDPAQGDAVRERVEDDAPEG